MITNTRTIHSAKADLLRSRGKAFSASQNSTLNQRFGIAEGTEAVISTSQKEVFPITKYLVIGVGGMESSGAQFPNHLAHSPANAALNNHIPFRMVPIEADLSSTERAKYRLRVLEEHGGASYYAYYARVVDLNESEIITASSTVTEGLVSNEEVHSFDEHFLTEPTMTIVDNSQVMTNNGYHMLVKTTYTVVLDDQDISHIVDACVIRFGDDRAAVISEVGICAGTDITYNKDYNDGEGNVEYTEAINMQIYNFVPDNKSLYVGTTEVRFSYASTITLPLPVAANL